MRLAFKVLILALAVPNNLASPNPKPSDRLTDCAANNKWEHGCDDIENICQISCAKNVEGQKCENPCDGTSEITYDEMVATKCEEICNASKDDSAEPEHCRFWRWVGRHVSYLLYLHFTIYILLAGGGWGRRKALHPYDC